ncbi:small, acid-soluble spore protein, alpha/beta type [Halalkalibacterium ligniniphilum]|uniref:small, acid-soluble spore protein, alpha/beta type n=1 Tax=Halalkalibacterium ligniniphilum TaxID=1134413 RepID=UPI000345B90C|nr:small, acid-soluble spore protein, alpha/beta type [Halalkalibacterium ligniniphilum]
MTERNKLLIPQSGAFLEQFREEIAHEFGIHYSVHQTDVQAKNMTKMMMRKTCTEKRS